MDDKVVPIKPERSIQNRAKCLACKHEWHGVAPVGTEWLKCPACELEMGHFIGTVVYDGDHWHCKCGNDLFRIQPHRTYCPCCGEQPSFR